MPAAELTALHAWTGVVCYTLQIYFDFSGYSDMAIGLGRMFGFRFPRTSTTRTPRLDQDFWRRWHISLSAWFRDYVYIPLGGNRTSTGRMYLNLVLVFFLCGLWHGASWTFVVWGLYHGVFLVLERAGLAARVGMLPRTLRHAYAVLVVMVGWVFFRADTLGERRDDACGHGGRRWRGTRRLRTSVVLDHRGAARPRRRRRGINAGDWPLAWRLASPVESGGAPRCAGMHRWPRCSLSRLCSRPR